MSGAGGGYEVPEPILNPPYDEPARHWYLKEGATAEMREGRRPSLVFPPRDRLEEWDLSDGTLERSEDYEYAYELKGVNLLRRRVKDWRAQGCPGATRTTAELLAWWRRDGRQHRLFFAQIEAAETIVFLVEARRDFLQGIAVPRDEPSAERREEGFAGFLRYACKMATGAGKTTVMGMLCAWSILNKVNDRGDRRFSDVVLAVCPNVTIRDRLRELDPELGEASVYRTRDLVPPHLMPLLTRGRVLVTNWHVFEPQGVQTGGVSAKVSKAGKEVRTTETIHIGAKTTTARGKRYLTLEEYERQKLAGIVRMVKEIPDKDGNLKKALVEAARYVESDTAFVNRILGREVGGKQNILVLNDEAHHAYRIQGAAPGEGDEAGATVDDEDDEESSELVREATVWIDGLDRIQKLRGINLCIDLSATPYYLGAVGKETGRPFPWVVSDFGLTDAIESGLVKIPQLVTRDTTGAEIPSYFNIWQWVLKQLTAAERGGKRANPKPEAILKYAHHPIRILASSWEEEVEEWRRTRAADPRPPVFIIVCKNTRIAKVMYEWLAEDAPVQAMPPAKIEGLRNREDAKVTIRVDSKVVHETDSDEAKSDESRWMRFTLDTVGKVAWPADAQARPVYPPGFEALAGKLGRPLHPPGRDVRCIVSVGMLTEGWDCNTVTHIVGLRPFMSQLLCEQVVGRALRRASYDVNPATGKFEEEIAKVFGVPFEVIPFKASKTGPRPPAPKRFHVVAEPAKSAHEISFPRVEGYTQAIRNHVTVDWRSVPTLVLEPGKIPPEVEMKALSVNNKGRLTLSGPGRADDVTLEAFRNKHRLQELVFDLSRTLVRDSTAQPTCSVPAHVLFPQVAAIVNRYIHEKVTAKPPASKKDIFLAPYYGWVVERLVGEIRPDTSSGEAPEVPRYEASRPPGSTADVDFWTSRDVRPTARSHVNYVVADTKVWEQAAAYRLDKSPHVAAFVKNAGLGFAIPYLNNGQPHDYVPDFIARIVADPTVHLVLEVKGYDPLEEVKRAAAHRWVAVNADGTFGRWAYSLVKDVSEIDCVLKRVAGGV